MRIMNCWQSVILCGLMSLIPNAYGQQTPPNQPDKKSMAQMHRKAAEAHTKMAECLESDKTVQECHQQLGFNQMPMHGAMGRGQGRRHGKNEWQRNDGPRMSIYARPNTGSKRQRDKGTREEIVRV